jgi:Tfp pilus assembly protein PilV
MNCLTFLPRRQIGATYIEVLLASVLLAISLVPMTNAVRGAIDSSAVHEDTAIQQLHLTAKLEDVLAETFSSLEEAAADAGSASVPAIYSDGANAHNRRLVYLSLYDGDNADSDDDPFTGVDPGLMWIRTEIEGTLMSVESLVSK